MIGGTGTRVRLFGVWAGLGLAVAAEGIEMPFTRQRLDNGLTVIVHQDRKAPIVAVNVWYHVGSKNEPPGRQGFAHLFEHLMFNGSEHFNADFFKAAEKVGATGVNGSTSKDRTNYFATAPREALDFLLWLESDRMGHLLGVVTQDRLDEQRGVVQNEIRQHENQPYAVAHRLITRHTWPAGHPYAWQVGGSVEDLEAATLDDVRDWFQRFYGPGNATVVVAGDVDPEAAFESVRRRFGSLPAGPPIERLREWVGRRAGTLRQTAEDRVPLARVYQVWNIPRYGTVEGVWLELAADILASGKSSRLYRRLVYQDRLATDVNASAWLGEIAGQFYIVATVAEGVETARVEAAIAEELSRFLRDGPTQRELQRVQTQAEAGLLRGLERIGGFGGKSDRLARDSVFLDDPAYYRAWLRDVRAATRRTVRDTARDWLSDGVYILEVRPLTTRDGTVADVDRSALPVPALRPEARFPEIRQATLDNGLRLVLAERPGAPVAQINLLVPAGFSADAHASPGTARLTLDMLLEGTRRRSALEISEELDMLGAELSTHCSLDICSVSLNTLRDRLDPALEIFADVILNPAFPAADFSRRQAQRLADIRQEIARPSTVPFRLLPRILYGEDHPYAMPMTGTGSEQAVAALTPADLKRFHATWFRPGNATLVVTGDITLEDMMSRAERLFGRWRPGDTPSRTIGEAAASAPSVTLVDWPGAPQSVILAGNVAPPRETSGELAVELMNRVLGGDFTSRINLNLREEKRWTYGAQTAATSARGPRMFYASVSVQPDKTAEAMRELADELRGVVGPRPVTAEEFERVAGNQALQLAGRWETVTSVAHALNAWVVFGLPDDYYATLADQVGALTREDLCRAAQRMVRPDAISWVVVGDRAVIEADLRALEFGEFRVLNPDGTEP